VSIPDLIAAKKPNRTSDVIPDLLLSELLGARAYNLKLMLIILTEACPSSFGKLRGK